MLRRVFLRRSLCLSTGIPLESEEAWRGCLHGPEDVIVADLQLLLFCVGTRGASDLPQAIVSGCASCKVATTSRAPQAGQVNRRQTSGRVASGQQKQRQWHPRGAERHNNSTNHGDIQRNKVVPQARERWLGLRQARLAAQHPGGTLHRHKIPPRGTLHPHYPMATTSRPKASTARLTLCTRLARRLWQSRATATAPT